MMVETKCALCGSDNSEHYLTSSDRLSDSDSNQYNIVKCAECGFLYTNPRPVDHEKHSAPFIESGDAFNILAEPKSISDRIFRIFHPASVRWKRRAIDNLPTIGRLLDFGCRTGDFLFAMKTAKWEVQGIEADKLGMDYAVSHYGLDVVSSLEELVENNNEKYDVITMWHTLDKVPDLPSTLESLKLLLEDDGYLLIGLPNIQSYDAQKYKSDWIGLDLPRHLYHFDRAHLTKLAENHGFSVSSYRNIPWDTLHNVFMSALKRANKHRWNARWSINWPLLIWTLMMSWLLGGKWFSFGQRCASSGVLYYLRREKKS